MDFNQTCLRYENGSIELASFCHWMLQCFVEVQDWTDPDLEIERFKLYSTKIEQILRFRTHHKN